MQKKKKTDNGILSKLDKRQCQKVFNKYGKGRGRSFKRICKRFKNVLNEVSNIMQKELEKLSEKCLVKRWYLEKFDLNPIRLEGLLKLEDKILTFFMETLPKIPQFIASAFAKSISVMLSTIKLNIDKKQIRAMIKNINDNSQNVCARYT